MLKTYDPREIRQILKDMQYTEIIPPEHAEHRILYFQKDVLVELKMDEEYLPLQIEVLCGRIGLTKDEFDDRNKKAKKHKI